MNEYESYLTSELLKDCCKVFPGQVRKDDFYHNALWYNINGEKIGWGDLSKKDLKRLIRCLKEPLLILDEKPPFWNFFSKEDLDEDRIGFDKENPGIGYLLSHTSGLVIPYISSYKGALYKFSPYFDEEKFEWKNEGGFKYLLGHTSQAQGLVDLWTKTVNGYF